MSDNRPNNHVRVLCFAHSLCSFWKLVVAFTGQRTHIQYAMKSSWCTAENTSVWGCCECLNGMWRSRVLYTLFYTLYKRLTFAVSVSSLNFVNIGFFGCFLHRTGWMSVSERLLVHRHQCFGWVDVDHVCSLRTTVGPAGICVHIKNTVISERNDKNSCMSLLHSHFLPICFNATIYEPLCSCTIFKTLTVFFPFFSSE